MTHRSDSTPTCALSGAIAQQIRQWVSVIAGIGIHGSPWLKHGSAEMMIRRTFRCMQ